MALVVGTNSWSTIVEVDAYLTDRMEATDWFVLAAVEKPGEISKTTLLVTSFFWLKGSPQLELADSLSDANVKNAQAEAALFLLKHYKELDDRRAAIATGLKEFEVSKRVETFEPRNLRIPDHILGMLSIYASGMNTFATLLGEYDS